MNPEDEEEIGPLLQMAIQDHEFYSAYVEAGFTEAQALQLIIGLKVAAANMPPIPPFPQQNST